MSEKIEVGAVYEGKVLKIKPFGAIVSLSDNDAGLVHISHISSSYVQNVADHLSIGDVVNVKVLSCDPSSGKIALSIKDTPQPIKSPTEEAVYHSQEQDYRQRPFNEGASTFEEKFKEWVKSSNERQAGLNKRNKRR